MLGAGGPRPSGAKPAPSRSWCGTGSVGRVARHSSTPSPRARSAPEKSFSPKPRLGRELLGSAENGFVSGAADEAVPKPLDLRVDLGKRRRRRNRAFLGGRNSPGAGEHERRNQLNAPAPRSCTAKTPF